jgi:hypothetical protein
LRLGGFQFLHFLSQCPQGAVDVGVLVDASDFAGAAADRLPWACSANTDGAIWRRRSGSMDPVRLVKFTAPLLRVLANRVIVIIWGLS